MKKARNEKDSQGEERIKENEWLNQNSHCLEKNVCVAGRGWEVGVIISWNENPRVQAILH